MQNPVNLVRNLDWDDPKVKVGAGAVGVAVVYLFWQGHREAKTGATQDAPPIPDTFGTVNNPATGLPGVIGNVGTYPVPGPAGPTGPPGPAGPPGKNAKPPKKPPVKPPAKPPAKPPTEKSRCGPNQVAVIRNGKTVCAGAPHRATITCPKGYIVVQSPGKPQRCSIANDANLKPGEKQTFYPKGRGGQVSAMDSYVGKVGGVFPAPMPITARRSYTVEDGDTPNSIARKVYGGSHWLDRLVNTNGSLANLKAGDVLEIS